MAIQRGNRCSILIRLARLGGFAILGDKRFHAGDKRYKEARSYQRVTTSITSNIPQKEHLFQRKLFYKIPNYQVINTIRITSQTFYRKNTFFKQRK